MQFSQFGVTEVFDLWAGHLGQPLLTDGKRP